MHAALSLPLAWDLSAGNVIPLALVFGVLSAFVPILNAEVFAAAAVAALPQQWWLPIIALAIGQTIGKCVLFLAARRGAGWLEKRHRRPVSDRPLGPWRTRLAVWSRMLLELLDRPVQAFVVVLLAASVGIPPLAIVSIVAGTRKMGFLSFLLSCGLGRIARFIALGWPIAAAIT